MRNFFVALLIGLSLIAFTAPDASAARLGGGMNFGRSFKAPTAPRMATPPRGAAAGAAAGAASTAAKGGIGRSLLYGAAGALGFMALAHMLGLGDGFGSVLMIIVLVLIGFMVFRFIMARKLQQSSGGGGAQRQQSTGFPNPFSRPDEPPAQKSSFDSTPQYSSGARSGSVLDEFANGGTSSVATATAANASAEDSSTMGVPKELNVENFLNMAKSYFIMLQKAWDSGDMDSLANYCTDDVFINLTHMRREIKGANVTEVKSLEAKLAGFETTPTEYVASVLFTGNLLENGVPAQVKERWNLVKPRDDSTGWLLAGIEQE
ncbi:MAG: transporter [Burkholderiales bacterium]|nr:transporter [Burkholderiales bacterium]